MKKVLVALIIAITFYSAAYCGVIYYDDPISVGIGARPIGMGRAFVAVADDANAMYLNPAGLGSQKTWQITTSGSNFLDEYQYTMLSGVNPTPSGVFGIGYVLSKISAIPVLSGGTVGTVDFYNQALVLSYGKNIGDNLPFLSNNSGLYGGAALKYYWKGYTGVINANATGYNMDLGLKYSPEEHMSYGLALQNIIGGSQMTGDFDPEDMPFTTKIGLAYNWLEQNVTFALDKDMYPDRPKVPWPMHVGAEWRAHPNLSLRAGYDQVASSADNGDLTNNTTFGVGLDYFGIKIDLAYMQNYAATNLASNIVSLSFYSQPFYVQEAPPAKKALPQKEAAPKPAAPAVAAPKTIDKKISVIPSSDLYTLNSKQVFSGAIDFDVTDVWINGRKLEIRSDRAFAVTIPLNVGKNEKIIRVRDISSSEAKITRKIIRLYVPADLSFDEVNKKDFEYKVLYTELYRYLGKDYSTDKKLSREILALIISKAKKLDLSLKVKAVSQDVSYTYWAAGFIKAVKSAGIMSDYGDGTFKPDKIVTEAELANIMARAGGIDKASIQVYLATKPPEGEASIEDLVELIYLSGMLGKDIDSYKSFIGAEGFMEEAIPPVKEAAPVPIPAPLPPPKVVPAPAAPVIKEISKTKEAIPTVKAAVPVPPPAPLPRPVVAPAPAAPVVAAPKTIDKKISIIPSADLYTLIDEQAFIGTIDPDVTDLWINGKKAEIKSDRTFLVFIPLNIGKNEIIIRVRDTSSSEAKIARKMVRFYIPDDLPFEEVHNKDFAYKVIYTELYRYLGKDYRMDKKLSREILALIISKAKKLDLSLKVKAVSQDVSYAYWAAKFINAVKSAGIMSDYGDGTFQPDKLVTRAELANIMAKAGGIDKASIQVDLAAKPPGDASIEDLVELIYISEMLGKDIDSYSNFIGIENLMEEAPPVKEVAPVPTPKVAPVPPVEVPAKSVTDKIKIINPQDKTYTFDSEITFSGKIDPDVKEIWINDNKVPFKIDGTFSKNVPLAYGKNQVTVRIRDSAKNEATISMNLERQYLPKGVATEEAKSKYIDKAIIQTKVRDLLGKDYSPSDRISKEQLDAILKKIKNK